MVKRYKKADFAVVGDAEQAAGLTPNPETGVVETAAPEAPKAEAPKAEAPKQEVDHVLVLGAKAPKHRVGHTGAAWAVIVPKLPCKASELAKLPELCVPECGGPKGNGMLYVSYAMRRGWLAKQA